MPLYTQHIGRDIEAISEVDKDAIFVNFECLAKASRYLSGHYVQGAFQICRPSQDLAKRKLYFSRCGRGSCPPPSNLHY
jgi:hypothetical protein